MRWVESITKEEWEKIDQVIAKHQGRHGALIPVLKETQDDLRIPSQKCPAPHCRGTSSFVFPSLRGGLLLCLFHHHPKRQAHHPGLPGNGLLCQRKQTDPWTISKENLDVEGRRNHKRSKILSGSGSMPRMLQLGPGDCHR